MWVPFIGWIQIRGRTQGPPLRGLFMAKHSISGKTVVYALLGYPVAHTFSPAMHNAAFQALGIDAVYTAFTVKPHEIKNAVNGVRALEFGGVNLTIPHKEICLPYLNELSPEAQAIGAVNTIVRDHQGKLTGHNTDGRGFVRALERVLRADPSHKQVFLFGAGGAGKAVAVQLAIEGIQGICIADTSAEQTRRLANTLKKKFPKCKVATFPSFEKADIERAIVDCDILINATPCGMKASDPIVVSPRALHRKLIICDLIYNPAMTALTKEARKRNLKVMNGLGMLLYQGVIAFELWTGKKAPVEVMAKALEQQMRKSQKSKVKS